MSAQSQPNQCVADASPDPDGRIFPLKRESRPKAAFHASAADGAQSAAAALAGAGTVW